VAELLLRLRKAGTHEQAVALLERDPAALDDRGGVALLQGRLRQAGRQAGGRARAGGCAGRPGRRPRPSRRPWWRGRSSAAAAGRAGAVRQDDPPGGDTWSELIRRVFAESHAAATLDLDRAAHVPLDKPRMVAQLLRRLREAGAHEQAATLLERDPAVHVPLDDPYGVAILLDSLRAAGARDQAAVLADRAAAHVPFDTPDGVLFVAEGVAELVRALREAGAHEQAAALVGRLPAAGLFGLFLEQHGRPCRSVPFRAGGRWQPERAMGLGRSGLMTRRRARGDRRGGPPPSACSR
jgi:hypothetical protein